MPETLKSSTCLSNIFFDTKKCVFAYLILRIIIFPFKGSYTFLLKHSALVIFVLSLITNFLDLLLFSSSMDWRNYNLFFSKDFDLAMFFNYLKPIFKEYLKFESANPPRLCTLLFTDSVESCVEHYINYAMNFNYEKQDFSDAISDLNKEFNDFKAYQTFVEGTVNKAISKNDDDLLQAEPMKANVSPRETLLLTNNATFLETFCRTLRHKSKQYCNKADEFLQTAQAYDGDEAKLKEALEALMNLSSAANNLGAHLYMISSKSFIYKFKMAIHRFKRESHRFFLTTNMFYDSSQIYIGNYKSNRGKSFRSIKYNLNSISEKFVKYAYRLDKTIDELCENIHLYMFLCNSILPQESKQSKFNSSLKRLGISVFIDEYLELQK